MGYGIEPAHDLAASGSVLYDYAFGPESIEQDRLACEKRLPPIPQLHRGEVGRGRVAIIGVARCRARAHRDIPICENGIGKWEITLCSSCCHGEDWVPA